MGKKNWKGIGNGFQELETPGRIVNSRTCAHTFNHFPVPFIFFTFDVEATAILVPSFETDLVAQDRQEPLKLFAAALFFISKLKFRII
jgi:hypothetical protein